MKHRPIVALVGPMGSGKTTVADAMIELAEHWRATRIPLAGPLKRMLREIGLNDDHLNGHLKEVPCPLLLGKTPRWAMQSLGTEWGRMQIGMNFWTALWQIAAINEIDHGSPLVVCDDCRFPDEAEAVRGIGGIVVRLERAGVSIASDHPSETQAVDIEADLIVINEEARPYTAARTILDHLRTWED